MKKRTKITTVGQLKEFFDENGIPNDAEIVMYNSMDEGDCCVESASYYVPEERADSDYYCKGDSVFEYGFKNLNGVVVMFG